MLTAFKKAANAAIRPGLLVLAIASVGSPALGQSDGSWQCAADNGRFAENPQPLPNRIRSISGRIQMDRDLSDDRWNPVANIGFSTSTAEGSCNCAGLKAVAHHNLPGIVTFYVEANGHEIGFAQGPLGRPITFRLSIDDAGLLSATIGKTDPLVKTVRLRDPRHDTLRMSCSSTEVTFLDVRAG